MADEHALDPAATPPGSAGPVDPLPLLGDIFDALPVAVLVVDASSSIVMVNRETEALLRYGRGELLGRPVEVLVPESFREAHRTQHQAYLDAPASRRMGANRDLRALRSDGSLLPVEIALKPLAGASGLMVIAAIVDISARKALEEHARDTNIELERRVAERTADLERSNQEKLQMLARLEQARIELERLSRMDPLTGLANRREFAERTKLEQQRSERRDSPLCVAMLDIDWFKRVNDCHGHALGDEVLRRVAGILQHQCRAVDVVARHGGEEFALALPDTSLDLARMQCERIRAAIEAYPWSGLRPRLAVTASIGVAVRAGGESAEAALARADALLYEAKRKGRNRVEGGTAAPPSPGQA